MMLWLALIVLCSAAAVGVSIPLIRRYEKSQVPKQDAAVYQDQLKEVDRDFQTGSINKPEAAAAKSEIGRRLEAAVRDTPAARPLTGFWRIVSLVLAAGLVIIGGVALYGFLGSPTMPMASQQQAQAEATPERMIMGMIAKLANKLQTNPRDQPGWSLMIRSLIMIGDVPDAESALAKAIDIFKDDAAAQEAFRQVAQAAKADMAAKP